MTQKRQEQESIWCSPSDRLFVWQTVATNLLPASYNQRKYWFWEKSRNQQQWEIRDSKVSDIFFILPICVMHEISHSLSPIIPLLCTPIFPGSQFEGKKKSKINRWERSEKRGSPEITSWKWNPQSAIDVPELIRVKNPGTSWNERRHIKRTILFLPLQAWIELVLDPFQGCQSS